MAGTGPQLSAAVQQYDAATGQSIDPTQPWNSPNWSDPSNPQSSGDGQFNAWFQQQYGYVPNYGQANASSTPLNAPAASPQSTAAAPTPQSLQNLFQPTYMQQPTQGAATTYGGTQVAPAAQLSQSFMSSLSPTASIQQIQAGLAPQYAQANANLNNQLAAAGVEGGSAIDAQQQLQSAETGTTASAIQAAIQNSQSLQNNAQQYNTTALNNNNLTQAGYDQQTGLQNTSATNQFNLQNLQNLYGTNQYNTTAANANQQQYANALLGQYNTDQNAYNTTNNLGLSGSNTINNTGLNGSQNLAGNIANNYQIQTGAGNGVASSLNGLGQYFATPQPGTVNGQTLAQQTGDGSGGTPYQVS